LWYGSARHGRPRGGLGHGFIDRNFDRNFDRIVDRNFDRNFADGHVSAGSRARVCARTVDFTLTIQQSERDGRTARGIDEPGKDRGTRSARGRSGEDGSGSYRRAQREDG
jgi:hypothetical protein